MTWPGKGEVPGKVQRSALSAHTALTQAELYYRGNFDNDPYMPVCIGGLMPSRWRKQQKCTSEGKMRQTFRVRRRIALSRKIITHAEIMWWNFPSQSNSSYWQRYAFILAFLLTFSVMADTVPFLPLCHIYSHNITNANKHLTHAHITHKMILWVVP